MSYELENGGPTMKVILRLLLIITLLFGTTEAFSQEKKTTVKLGSIGEILVDSYQIGIGDVLEITTWKEPDFSRPNIIVRTDGKITFPLLSDVPAAGLSPMELKYNLELALKAYVSHPVVTVHVNDPVSQKFYVLGEVGRPSPWPADSRNGLQKRKSSCLGTKAVKIRFTALITKISPVAKTSARTSNSKPMIQLSFHKYGTMSVVSCQLSVVQNSVKQLGIYEW
jgi:hypothetical protein